MLRDLLLKLFAKELKGKGIGNLDGRITTYQLMAIFFDYFVRALRGWSVFPSQFGKIFIGNNTKIINKNFINTKSGTKGKISIGSNVFINALSTEGLILSSGVSLQRGVSIECSGTLVNIGKGVFLDENVGVGSFTFIGGAGGVSIGKDTIIGNYVSFHPENHIYADLTIPIRLQGVTRKGIEIGCNCWIGAKVTILDGVTLGSGVIVAAGAVVKEGIYPDNVILGGIPAKVLKTRS